MGKIDKLEFCIGIFEAESKTVVAGREARYYVDLANCTPNTQDVIISFDIYRYYPSQESRHPQDHHAYFDKWISLDPCSTRIEIKYDWIYNIHFLVGDNIEDCDEKWIGPMNKEGMYSVHLILMDHEKNIMSEVVLFQDVVVSIESENDFDEMFAFLKLVDLRNLGLVRNWCISMADRSIEDKDIVILQGKDYKNMRLVIDYFNEYCSQKHVTFRLYLKEMPGDGILEVGDDKISILTQAQMSYEDALQRGLLLCDPSVDQIDLSGMIMAGLNEMPLLVQEKSPLKTLCTTADCGLYFCDYDAFAACLDVLLGNPTLRKRIGSNGTQCCASLYEWAKFLGDLKSDLGCEYK